MATEHQDTHGDMMMVSSTTTTTTKKQIEENKNNRHISNTFRCSDVTEHYVDVTAQCERNGMRARAHTRHGGIKPMPPPPKKSLVMLESCSVLHPENEEFPGSQSFVHEKSA